VPHYLVEQRQRFLSAIEVVMSELSSLDDNFTRHLGELENT